MYKLIGLYALVIPLRIVLQATSPKQHARALFVLWLVLMVLPNIAEVTHTYIISYVPLSYELLYFVGGYYLFYEEKAHYTLYYFGAFISAIAMVVLFVFDYDMFFMPQSSLMFVYSAGICIAARSLAHVFSSHLHMRGIWHKRLVSLIQVLASYSFGMYVLHVMFLHFVVRYVMTSHMDFLARATVLHGIVFQVFLFCLSVVGSCILTKVLRRIPFFAKYL